MKDLYLQRLESIDFEVSSPIIAVFTRMQPNMKNENGDESTTSKQYSLNECSCVKWSLIRCLSLTLEEDVDDVDGSLEDNSVRSATDADETMEFTDSLSS